MTGLESVFTFMITGSVMSSGSRERMAEICSRTSWTARSMSRSSSNSTMTEDEPSMLEDETVRTPFTVLTASSILSVTSMSMISGLAPVSLVVMLTMGKSTLGKRSTPISG